MNKAPRILIVRLTALGDVIHGLPVATALRRHFSNATLAWAVEGRGAELIEGHPALDEVIPLSRRWWRSPRGVAKLRRQLRQRRFDVAVDLQCLTKSAFIAWLSGAPLRLGADGPDGRELSKWLNNQRTLVNASHVVEHYLQILRPLGIMDPQVEFEVPERAQEAEFADQLLAELQLSTSSFVVLNPGAGWPSKMWPAERYGLIAEQLWQRYRVPSLAVWGGEAERPLAEQIVASSHSTAKLAPATTMRQLAAVTRRASLFVGSDTGPMHLAVAVGTPTISLHGTSRAEWCGAYGTQNIRLQAYYQAGTARQRRSADNEAMRAITVEQVLTACEELLSRHRVAQAS